MPPTQCCCSPSFGLKASNGDFRGESCSRRGTVSPTESLPLCPLLAPARWGSLAVRAAHGGTPGTFRSSALRMERCGQRKERQRVEPRSVAAALLFLGRKKAKGNGKISPRGSAGMGPLGQSPPAPGHSKTSLLPWDLLEPGVPGRATADPSVLGSPDSEESTRAPLHPKWKCRR